MTKCVSCGVLEAAEGYGAYCADCDGLNGPVPLLDEAGELVSPRTKENPMEAQYVEFVTQFGSDYDEDRKAVVASAMKYQPDMETLALAVDEAVEWLCSFRGDEPEGIGPEMIDAAIKTGVGAKASGADADGIQRAIDDVCSELFDTSLQEVRAGTRKLVAYEDTIA